MAVPKQEGSPWPANGFGRVAKSAAAEEGTPTSSLRPLPDQALDDEACSSEVKPPCRKATSGTAPSAAAPQPQQQTAGRSTAAEEAQTAASWEHASECSLGMATKQLPAAEQTCVDEPQRAVTDAQGSSAADSYEQQGSKREEHTASRRDGGANHRHEVEPECAGAAAPQPPATPVPFIDRMEPGAPRPISAGAAAGPDGCATPDMATPAGASGALFETPGFFDPMFTPAADLGQPTLAQRVCTTPQMPSTSPLLTANRAIHWMHTCRCRWRHRAQVLSSVTTLLSILKSDRC